MPRSARKESGYGIYHVMMRGINRQAIFDKRSRDGSLIRSGESGERRLLLGTIAL